MDLSEPEEEQPKGNLKNDEDYESEDYSHPSENYYYSDESLETEEFKASYALKEVPSTQDCVLPNDVNIPRIENPRVRLERAHANYPWETRTAEEDMVSEATYPTQYTQVLSSLSCLLYTSPSPRDKRQSRMPSSA